MCGIAGFNGKYNKDTITRMLDAEKHRGPDGRKIWISPDKGTTLGHVRLAIIDVEGGKQPISNEDESLWAIVNGEIYNFQSIRQKLESRHRFRTNSDSEVVIHLFEEKGSEMIHDLDGMFAIVIWGKEHGLFFARDPLGIKPLYFGYDKDDCFYFASEIKSVVSEIPELKEFPNGHFMFLGEDPEKYYEVPLPEETICDEKRAIDTVDQSLVRSVKKRLMSDVPLGVFLSGGLDSSLISAIVRQNVDGELHSFSVGLEGSPDIENARDVAKYLGTIHHERLLMSEDIYPIIPNVIRALESCDPALVRSAVPTYFVSELASKYVKVILSGEGADELFAGYHYLRDFEDDTEKLSNELRYITAALHNSNLQRVDRMTMAHGLEGRVPFLDTELVNLSFAISSKLKRRGIEKWLLRKVANRYLSESIVWRKKEKFAIGTGIGPVLERYAEIMISDEELKNERSLTGKPFKSKEELLYWEFFKKYYGREDVLRTMGRSRSLDPGQQWISTL